MNDEILGTQMTKESLIGMPGATFPANDARGFTFNGNALSLQCRLQALTQEQIRKIVDISIVVTGIQVKSTDNCCAMATLIGGSIIIIPLFFICLQCWKRRVCPAFNIPLSTYEGLHRLLQGENVSNMTLNVTDSMFNEQKANILYNMVSSSGLKGLTFVNSAGRYDYKGSGFSNFERNMKPIQQLQRLITDIRWAGNNYGYAKNNHQQQ